MEAIKKELKDSLYKEYGTQLLSTAQVAEILNISKVTLGRWKKQGIYLNYKQNKNAKNAPIFYVESLSVTFPFKKHDFFSPNRFLNVDYFLV
jgi:hypothetical protein